MVMVVGSDDSSGEERESVALGPNAKSNIYIQ